MPYRNDKVFDLLRQVIFLLNEIFLHSDKEFEGLIATKYQNTGVFMIQFNQDYLDIFLSVVRKYMQLRGGLSQKDLAELTHTGVSTMSRFINQKTKDIDPQMVAKIVAKLDIPLHEVIDFVEEDSTAKFKKLVSFHREDESADRYSNESEADEESIMRTQATVSVGGRKTTIPFGDDQSSTDQSITGKLRSLTPRQKAYVSDFLNLDLEGRDLVVDIGNSLLRYFKQRGVEF